ncbi:spore germination protein [Cohnella sp.]|uniref:spore germination protein n=1 Tax=Cohnella sp. TaxID=1883426 RepID=UPI0037039E4A
MFPFNLFSGKRRYSSARQNAGNKGVRPFMPEQSEGEEHPLDPDLSRNLEEVARRFPDWPDFIVFRFVSGSDQIPAALLYLDGLTDKKAINDNILQPMMSSQQGNSPTRFPEPTIGDVRRAHNWQKLEYAIMTGDCVLLLDGCAHAVVYNTSGWPQRSITDPQLESSLKGAHQGFVETAAQNLALLRRYLPNKELRIHKTIIGKRGKTTLFILYLADVAHPDVLEELRSRLDKIDVDAVINTGEVAEYIEDNPFSPFPQFILTERPDSAASQLLQGRYVVIVDRSPSVIIAPSTFISLFQSVDDYSSRWMIASFIRLLRFLAFFIALLLPAVYISFISYNYEVIPLQLFLSIAESRERVPFPPLLEAMLMEIMLEMMREAGIRLPASVGQTIGIVGGIVVGQAAVQAGVVSNIMVIVVASTAIASFILPSYDMGTAVRLLRFPMMIMASLFGLVGIVIGFMTILIHLMSLESLGTPYGSPLAPVRWSDMKDTFVRFPLWSMVQRPKSARPIQDKRVGRGRPRGDG